MSDITAAELSALMNRPPEAAVAFFQAKGLALTWNWHDQWQDVHSRAFTIAKLARLDILQDLKAGVQHALDTGETEAAFKKRLGALLQQKGWWGKKIVVGSDGQAEVVQEGSPRRLSTIYRTNLQSAYMAGRWQQFQAEADEAPYVQYIAVMDGRTRPGHARFNGKVFKITDPVWQVIAPPNGFGCRCRIRNLDARELAQRGLKVETDSHVEYLQHDPLQDKRSGKWDGDTAVQRGISIPDPDRPGKRMTLWADRGWDYNPGAAGLEHMGGLLLKRAVTAEPRMAALAVRAALDNPAVLGSVAGAFGKTVDVWAANVDLRASNPRHPIKTTGEFMHVGGIAPVVLDKLYSQGIRPASAVISVRDEDIVHTLRPGKKAPVDRAWYRDLPRHLRTADAVLLDTSNPGQPALLMVYRTKEAARRLVVRLDVPAKEARRDIMVNVVRTGRLVEDSALRGFEVLEGAL